MMDRVIAVVPFADTEAFRIVEIGCGDGRLAAKLLETFPQATIREPF